MEGPTYKGRDGRGKREREGPPGYYGFPPGPRGARIVTAITWPDGLHNCKQLNTGWRQGGEENATWAHRARCGKTLTRIWSWGHKVRRKAPEIIFKRCNAPGNCLGAPNFVLCPRICRAQNKIRGIWCYDRMALYKFDYYYFNAFQWTSTKSQ